MEVMAIFVALLKGSAQFLVEISSEDQLGHEYRKDFRVWAYTLQDMQLDGIFGDVVLNM